MKKHRIYVLIILVLVVLIGGLLLYKKKDKVEEPPTQGDPIKVVTTSDFDLNIIKQVNKDTKENYMISPLSIAYALTILKEGAEGNTLTEINNVLGDYRLTGMINIKDRISIANLLFIKNKWKNDINSDYIKTIQDKYSSDLIFDEFTTPDAVNNWVSDKTFKMIPNALSSIDPEFVLGIANAIAIDVEWDNKFECNRTHEGDFTLENGTKLKTAYMNGSNDVVYLENSKAKGIIKDYAPYDMTTGEKAYENTPNKIELEYIAILPNGNVQEYVNNFTKKDLNDLIKTGKSASSDLKIRYSLPKYKYDYDYGTLKEGLINLGIKDAFSPEASSFGKMVNKNSDLKVYLDTAIHKSHIEITENGTKAAAVTILMMFEATAIEKEPKIINIEFNKPFIYIIKEKNSDNIWFFGTVYTPIKWEDNVTECNYE